MVDPLAEVLRSVRLTGGVFLDSHFTAPWSVYTQIRGDDCRPFLDAPKQIIAYHFIMQGSLIVRVDGAPPVTVEAGEIVLLPRNDPHTLASGEGLPPTNARDLIRPGENGGLARIRHGGGGEGVHVVCGFLGSDQVHVPLFDVLPSILKVDVRQATARDWVEASMRLAANELLERKDSPSALVPKLSELLLIEAVRSYATQPTDGGNGWLKGFEDRHVGRALVLLHRDVARNWTAEALAREVFLSRSAFVKRFTELVGVPPIRYLTRLRLQMAEASLLDRETSIAQVANALGYESEEGFSRAFKRHCGRSPAQWRAERRA
ncbi:MAG: AraC family transcriptional regulator [Hyphomicrobiales bacterium]